MSSDFKNDIDISGDLQKELSTLPLKFLEYSEKSEILEATIKRTKMKLDIMASKKESEARKNPKELLGAEKYTEATIKMFLSLDDELNEIRGEIIEQEKNKKIISAAVRALELKSSSLKSLVSLSVMGVASTKVTYNNNDEGDEQKEIEEAKEKIRNRYKRTT